MAPRNTLIHSRPKTAIVDGHLVNAGQMVIASAALVSVKELARVNRKLSWQTQAWEFYDEIPELRFGTGWISNALSKARLYVGTIDPDGSSEPLPIENDSQLNLPLSELFGGQSGQSEMLRRLAIQLSVPGESYLCGLDVDGQRRWIAASNDEIETGVTAAAVRLPQTDVAVPLDPANSVCIRLWRPHPKRGFYPDSPCIALRGVFKELQGLSKHVGASVDSRLAGAGVLVIPESASMPNPAQSEGSANPLHPDPLVSALIEAMVTPLNDPDSAAAVVPIVMRVPDQAADAIKHLSFSTPFDANLQTLREAAIRRVATGLDLPAEVLLGLSEANHWSAWQIEESAIKLHVEPLLGLVCDALTSQYLRPALTALGEADPAQYALWYDTSDLALRPNRAPESISLHDKGLISADAARRENGFANEDAPDDEEAQRIFLTQLALTNGQLAPQILPLLGIELPESGLPPSPGGPELSAPAAVNELQPATPAGQVRAEIPDTLAASLATAPADSASEWPQWMVAALEIATLRALGRAGQWLINSGSRSLRGAFRQVPLHEIHSHVTASADNLDDMLSGAYRELTAALPEQPCLQLLVDDYVRALLLTGQQHQRGYLVEAIGRSGCVPHAA